MDRSTYVQLKPDVQVLDAAFEPSYQPVEFTTIVLSSRGRGPQARLEDEASR